ncbi:MAG: hypothetical protein HY865_00095 [Chloroflexi bacterium]|nr:hypothetical protein [Chloroflexota bacterium]
MKSLTEHKWFYPLVYFALLVLCFWPPYTEIPYDPHQTQAVIIEILTRSTQPYAAWGWIFHLATLGVIVLAIFRPRVGGRAIAAYFGLNYLIVAAVQTHAVTESYGLAIQTGALVASGLLGILWLWVALRDKLQVSFKAVPAWRWFLLPFALLVFWLPIGLEGSKVVFNFNPLLFLTSSDYGLAYCFMTPVFLFLLILAYPNVDGFAFRVTAFNALLYGLLNLTHWFDPNLVVMGVMHLPLLVLALIALFLPRLVAQPPAQPA